MVKLLFVLMNEYRLWALPQALAALERRYPGAVEGRVYSVREINADAGLERALLADGAAADMAFLASHGSIQNLYCFSRLWEALEGRPVYFTSTMGDELAELLPRLGLEPALYAALDSYYQAGSPADLEGLVLCALNGRFGGDYPLSPPSPPRGQGVYTLEGFLPTEREAGYRARMAAETRPVIGVLIHDHYARTGNLEHVDALLRAIQARGGVPYALSDSFAADHGTEQGILYRMERFYRRADGTPIPGALVVSYGFSLTTLAGREARAGQVPASVFENWGLPVIQGLTTYFSADEYRRDIRGLDLVSLPVCVYQPEFDGQLISVPYAVTERTADGRKVCLPLPDRVTRVAELACRWAELARKPMPEKKVAVIFHNMPPRSDTIGSAHGLDTPETVFRVVRALENQGLRTAYSFSSGAEIIARIRAAVTNDNRWLSPEAALERAEATVPAEQYQGWFDRLNPETRARDGEELGPRPGHRDGVRGPDRHPRYPKRQPLCGGAAHALGAGAGGGALPQHRQYPAPLLPGLLPLGGRGVRGGRGAPRGHPRHPGVATGQGDRPVLRLLRRHLHRRGAPPLHLQHQHPGGGDAGQAPLLRLHTRPPDPLHGRRGHLRRPHRSGRGHRRLLSRPPGPACPGARTAGADLHPGGGAGGDYRSPAGAGGSGGRAGRRGWPASTAG